MDNNSENILWLVSVMKQYMDDDYAVETSYNWLRYNSKDDFELIYRTNKLMYEDTTVKDNKVTYDYYDANTYKKISSTTLEQ